MRIVVGTKNLADSLRSVIRLSRVANDPDADPRQRHRARKALLFAERYGKGKERQ